MNAIARIAATRLNRPRHLFNALLAGSLVSMTASADDVEIYTNTDSLGVNPNIVFVIDTSGSMGTQVDISTYDPAVDYAAPAGSPECQDDRIYARIGSSSTPSCNTNYWFEESKFRCEAAWDALDIDGTGTGTGYFVDRIARWNSGAWRSLHSTFYNYRNSSQHYECRDDAGDHGIDSTSSARCIRNGSYGPWSTNCYYDNSIYQNINNRTLYTGNYLNWYHYHGGSTGTTMSRLEIVVEAAKDLIDSVTSVNIGLVRFDTTGPLIDGSLLSDSGSVRNNQGGPVSYPLIDVSDPANKTILKGILDTYTDQGSTPLVETVTEALRYYRGETVNFGAPWSGGNLSSHPLSQSNGSYISPIEYDCGENYMVVFSDGAPTADWDADSAVNNMIAGTAGDMGSCDHGTSTYYGEDSCLDELANYMFLADHATDLLGNDLPGTQNITSYYISGFSAADDVLMNSAALRGSGGSHGAYEASNPSEFAAVFSSIIADILQVNASFTSPAVSVNALNRLRHNNDLYFALFQPTRSPHWPGNIKKYRLETTGLDEDGDGEPDLFIGDAHVPPRNAVDEATGLFVADGGEGSSQEGALSYWYLDANDPDGDQTVDGGAAHRLYDWDAATGYDADSRQYRVYTYLNDYAPDATEFNGSGISLINLHEDNADPAVTGEDGIHITKATLGFPDTYDDNEFLNRIMWARGVDVLDDDVDGDTAEGRPVMGGVLHTEPILVNYAIDDNGTPTDTDDTQTNVLFTTTNDGYLHILQSDDSGATGKPRLEHSAIVPKQVLDGIDELYLDSGSDVAYRLDSNIDIWRYEDESDGDDDITTGGNDHVYAYFGQRRGGNVVFAFDVTDPDYPELLWVIDPDMVPAGSSDPDVGPFQFMGQSWSKPKKHSILMANSSGNDLEPRDIVIYGGGYDNNSDDVPDLDRDQDAFGSTIYIVDANTGELLWWAGHSSFAATVAPDFQDSDMQYGFAADIRIADVNGDRFADVIFASDAGGQVWRFDIANSLNAGDSLDLSDRITGGVIADLQLDNPADFETAQNNRRFYYAPDVAVVQNDDSSAPILTVSIGSGYRAHPLNETVNDKFFVLKYDDVISRPADELDSGGNVIADGYDRVKIHVGDLLDVTNLNFAADPPPTLDVAESEALYTKGWFIDLTDDGEKALSESVTVDGQVIFTTYTPPADDSNTGDDQECSGNQGSGKTYVVSVIDGAPVANLDEIGSSTELELTDRVFNLKVSGIPPRPKVIFPDIDGVSGKIIVGRELLPVNIANAPEITYWVQD